MNKNLKQQILELKTQGLSYNAISEKLQCSKGTVSYHLGDGQVEKSRNRNREFKKNNPVSVKIGRFTEIGYTSRTENPKVYAKITRFHSDGKIKNLSYTARTFSVEDVLEKYSNNCYLTGRKIDLTNSRSYELDHILPRCLGGLVTFDNCGLACTDANQAKGGMSKENFFNLCVDVVRFNNLSLD